MAFEENKNKYSNIEHVRTNMLWMDIKIVDPEMETLMKQINEEQIKLKEALREKLCLIRYDTDFVQRENEQLKEWLRFKGIQFEDKKDHSGISSTNDIVIKEEQIDNVTNENESYEEKFNPETSEEYNHIEKSNKSEHGTMDIKEETNRLKSCYIKVNEEDYKECKNDALKKDSQNMNRKDEVCNVNNQNENEESVIATRTRKSTQVNVSAENIWLSEKRSKRGMERRRLVKNYKTTNKRKKNTKRKIVGVQNKEDIYNVDQS
ncbi:PREDICTED: uncharacterized protein LOC107063800 [Polistes dominula]|uniref:Uncharacterized protein LOC107063800 n=1 Tax=Polistes dominula TaxID=743375 RepID=A0ABM1HTU2_POLDO|nr:PREDICTED: uncharacterized protein LOC107063800 [Polistes dominula]XP_015171378.1 PREDICTED: uncharacterized protein LOC107063800 [Polistes dominula]XP_015171379.1 PREDICTED: uncharacterized protein LOC107063800 [Polistes dominula]